MKFPRDLSPDRRALSFLQRAPLVRRRGGWRFGAARITDAVVARLVATGVAVRDGDALYANANRGVK